MAHVATTVNDRQSLAVFFEPAFLLENFELHPLFPTCRAPTASTANLFVDRQGTLTDKAGLP